MKRHPNEQSIYEDNEDEDETSSGSDSDEAIDFQELYDSEGSDGYSSYSDDEEGGFDYSKYNKPLQPINFNNDNRPERIETSNAYPYRFKRKTYMTNPLFTRLFHIFPGKYDKRNVFHAVILCLVLFQAVNFADTGYRVTNSSSSLHDPKTEIHMIRMAEYDHPIFTPGSEFQLRQIQHFEGIPSLEFGELHTKKIKEAISRIHKPVAGASRFEFGDFSGIAATPLQYHKANVKQAELQRKFWTWVRDTTPPNYYDIKAKANTVASESEGGNNAVSSVTAGGLQVPELPGLKDVWDPMEPTDSPVFFHIPKAGGTTIKNVIGTCHRLTMATEVGVMNGHDKDTEIGVVRPYANPEEGKEGSPFVNVDTTTTEGLVRAKKLGLAESQLAELIVTPLLYDAEQMFSPTHKGRIFTIFRHPLERAISMFYYIQVADWESSYNPLLAKMSIEEYAKSTFVENNWMVRRLSNVDKTVKLTDDHLQIAMDIIRRKFLVGILSKKEESLDRFEKFFGWKFKVKPDNQDLCRKVLMEQGANTNVHDDIPEEGSDAYNALLFHNRWDILLYEYIEDLFQLQTAFVAHIPDNFRMIDATCAKCIPPTFPPIEIPVL